VVLRIDIPDDLHRSDGEAQGVVILSTPRGRTSAPRSLRRPPRVALHLPPPSPVRGAALYQLETDIGRSAVCRALARKRLTWLAALGREFRCLGHEVVPLALDDQSRLACAAALPDRCARSAATFATSALAYCAAHGMVVRWVLIGNLFCSTSAAFCAILEGRGVALRTRLSRSRPAQWSRRLGIIGTAEGRLIRRRGMALVGSSWPA